MLDEPILAAAIFVLKLSAWCLLPFVASLFLRRRSAAERHLLLVATLIGALALPIALASLPPIGSGWVAVPSTPTESSAGLRTADRPDDRSGRFDLAASASLHEPSRTIPRGRAKHTDVDTIAKPGVVEPAEPTTDKSRELMAAAPSSRSSHGVDHGSTGTPIDPRAAVAILGALKSAPAWVWLLLLWGGGSLFAIGRLALGLRRLGQVLRQAEAIEQPEVMTLLGTLRREIGLESTPAIYSSAELSVPVAIDPVPFSVPSDSHAEATARQAIVLPTDWPEWEADALRIALLHELAHLKRGDGWSNLTGSLVVALYWWHPAVSALATWARREAERAADDFVLAHGEAPSHYADQLLVFAKNLRQPTLLGVPLMNHRSSDLKQRVIAILDPARVRNPLSRKIFVAAGALALLLLVPLSGVRLISVSEAAFDGGAIGRVGFLPLTPIDVEVSTPSFFSTSQVVVPRVQFDGDSVDVDLDVEVAGHAPFKIAQHEGHGARSWKHDKHKSKANSAYSRAYEMYGENRFDEAAEAFAEAAAAGEKVATSLYNAACSYALGGQAENALAFLQQSIDAGWDDANHLVEDSDLDSLRTDDRFQSMVDRLFAANGDVRSPIEGYRLRSIEERYDYLVDSNSQDGKAWYRNGTDLLSLRRLGPAEDALGRAVDLLGTRADSALYNLACLHAIAGDTDRANESLERAIAAGYGDVDHMLKDSDLNSLHGTAGFESALQLARDLDLGQFRNRVKWHKKSEKHEHGENHHRTEYESGRWSEAVDFYRSWTSENPEIGRGWYNLGWALHHSRRFAEAIEPFERSAQAGYSPINSAYNIACGYAMSGSTDEAFRWLEEAISRGFKSPHHLERDRDLESLHSDARFRQLIWQLEDASD